MGTIRKTSNPLIMNANLQARKLSAALATLLILVITAPLDCLSQKPDAEEVVVYLSGLVMDSKTLLPLSGAVISDEENKSLGITDTSGYFNAKLSLTADKEIDFSFKIKKDGYVSFTQKEHWAKMGTAVHATYYVGIQRIPGKSKPFSEMALSNKTSTYDEVKAGFEKVKAQIDFDNKIDGVKVGNDDLFFKIDQNYYLVSETGWLKLTAEDSPVLINGKDSVPAKDINLRVKRSKVKRMSPSGRKDLPFEIFTSN
jgi:hypothetical protein